MVYVTLRFEGMPAEILEQAVKKGLGKTKSEVLRLGLLKLEEQYHVLDDEELTNKEIHLMEELLEKSIRTGNIGTEAELLKALK